MNKKFFLITIIGLTIILIGAILLTMNTLEIIGLFLLIIGIIVSIGFVAFYISENKREIEKIEFAEKYERLQEQGIMKEQRKKEENHKRKKWNAQRDFQERVYSGSAPYRKRMKRKQ